MSRKKVSTIDVLHYMDTIVEKHRQSGRDGTANMYKATRSRLSHYCAHAKLPFNEVNVKWVRDFEDNLRKEELGINTVTNYLSLFRSAYNRIVQDNLVSVSENPFRFCKLRPVSVYKRAIGIDVIMEIAHMDLGRNERLSFARDLFMFSFMACGMPFIDLAHLTKANIIRDTIIYHRVKTNTEIRIALTPAMKCLICKYERQNSSYLFPIVNENSSYADYKVSLRTYNRRLQKIGLLLTNPINLTSYVARHSWAMEAKGNNIPVAIIGEALGHTSEKATRFYLDSLDQSILAKANRKIISNLEKWIIKTESKKGRPLFME